MSKFSDKLSAGLKILNNLLQERAKDKNEFVSEKDILEAIDRLPENQADMIELGYGDSDTMVQVPSPKCWSLFKYVGLPSLSGLEKLEGSGNIYFTIPAGYEWDNNIKFWFIAFPFGGTNEDIQEFFTSYNVFGSSEEV
jgi:hypothetical protein